MNAPATSIDGPRTERRRRCAKSSIKLVIGIRAITIGEIENDAAEPASADVWRRRPRPDVRHRS